MQNRKSNARLQYESLEPKNLLAANLVADINQLSANSGNPRDIVAVGETAFFVAEDENGTELWKSDSSGTQMVRDIVPGPEGSFPHGLFAGENVLFFSGPGGTWRSDGTEDGTFVLADADLQAVSGNRAVLFRGSDVFVTDGDAIRVRSINFGDSTSDNEVVEAATDHFTVRRSNILSRIELNGSDPDFSVINWDSEFGRGSANFVGTGDRVIGFSTQGGLVRIYQFTDGGDMFDPPIESNDVLFADVIFDSFIFSVLPTEQSGDNTYFFGRSISNDSVILFRTNGTVEGTILISEFGDPTNFVSPSGISTAVDGNGGMWFTARSTDAPGAELWHTDGTAEGTRQVKDIAPGDDIGSAPRSLTFREDRLWFIADDATNGQQIWTSDGTEAGTVALTDFGNTTFDPQILGASNDQVIFSVGTTELGTELWTASADSAQLVRNINSQSASSLPGFVTDVGDGSFVFAATSQDGRELWQTDLTGAGTVLVEDISSGTETFGSAPDELVTVGGNVFFTANDGIHGDELWTLDASGTPTLFKDIEVGANSSQPNNLTVVGDTLYFAAQDSLHGMELWQSDGTPDGTRLLMDSIPGPVGLSPHRFVEANGELYFQSAGQLIGDTIIPSDTNQIWKVEDGETVLIYQNESNNGSDFLSVLNDEIFFLDGILDRTQIPRMINDQGEVEIVNGFEDFPGRSSAILPAMEVVADTLVSFDQDGIWLSDGQSEPGRFDSFGGRLSGTVVFTDEYVSFMSFATNYIGDPASRELVVVQIDVTDIVGLDTTHVTFTEQELFVGDPLALPEQSLMTFHRILPDPIEFDGLVYFAVEAENGLADVWSTDGTLEGTTQLTDVGFSATRTPITFHPGEENLFITADDGTLGAELWQLEISPDTRGDLNGDGAQDASDIDALFASIRTDENDPAFDVNQDGEVDNLDVDFLLQEVLNRRRGDVNLDGAVGFSDFLVLSQSFGSTSATWSQGDFTGDGEVTFADFLLLSSAFGESLDA